MAEDNVESQTTQISSLMSKEMKKGDTWYLVDSKWYNQWKKYVGYDSWDTSSIGDSSAHPGLMDNSSLLRPETNELKEDLTDELDYTLMPVEAWALFTFWYGICDGQLPIARKVIDTGVELYLINLKLGFRNNLANAVACKFSGGDIIQLIETKIRELFDIPDNTPVRMWSQYPSEILESYLK